MGKRKKRDVSDIQVKDVTDVISNHILFKPKETSESHTTEPKITPKAIESQTGESKESPFVVAKNQPNRATTSHWKNTHRF